MKINEELSLGDKDLLGNNKLLPFCLCGQCGLRVTKLGHKYRNFHYWIGKPAHNKGSQQTKETILKRKETWNKLFGGNPMCLEDIKHKRDELFLQKNGVRNPSNISEVIKKRENTYFKKHGYSNPFSNPEVITNILKTSNERYGGLGYTSFKLQKKSKDTLEKRTGYRYAMQIPEVIKKVHIKRKQTLVNRGVWLSDDQISDFQLYFRQVNKYTYHSIQKKFTKEEITNRKIKNIHIDHKYSIFQGFVDGIVPWIIGSIYNLEILPITKNCSKNSKCSITKEELFLLYSKNN